MLPSAPKAVASCPREEGSIEEIKVTIEEAHRAGLPVAAHCLGGVGFDLCLDLEIDCLEHEYFLTEKQIGRLAKADTWLVLIPSPYLSGEWQSTVPQELAAGFRKEREAASPSMSAVIRSGAKYSVGTDGLHGRLGQDITYLVQIGASPAEALAAATCKAAKVCGRIQPLGTLEAGKCADMIGEAGSPLTDSAAVNRVQTVIARGKVIRRKESV